MGNAWTAAPHAGKGVTKKIKKKNSPGARENTRLARGKSGIWREGTRHEALGLGMRAGPPSSTSVAK
eukprot:scaffold2229_cov113-Isochrysis_galbana.AAC.1